MSEQPTPRTDDEVQSTWPRYNHHVSDTAYNRLAELARQLERELAAACAQVATLREALLFIVQECDWEEGVQAGDNRIGDVCSKALASTPETKHPDTERLDYLASLGDVLAGTEFSHGELQATPKFDWESPNGTLRQAIDAARSASQNLK